MPDTSNECGSCGEVGADDPEMQCPKSKRECGHHCNHIWTHDACCWCGIVFEFDESQPEVSDE